MKKRILIFTIIAIMAAGSAFAAFEGLTGL